MLPSITYHARPEVCKTRPDDVIQFPNNHCPGLRCGGHFDNSYDFLKECLTALRIF